MDRANGLLLAWGAKPDRPLETLARDVLEPALQPRAARAGKVVARIAPRGELPPTTGPEAAALQDAW